MFLLNKGWQENIICMQYIYSLLGYTNKYILYITMSNYEKDIFGKNG